MPLFDQFGKTLSATIDEDGNRIEQRSDRWVNSWTGIGTMGDKTVHGHFDPVWRVLDQELVNLWNGSPIAQKIVEKVPKEMFRMGYQMEADGVSAAEAEDFHDWLIDAFNFDDVTLESFRWGRLFGGGLLVMGLNDGRHPWEPLDEENIKSLDYLNWVDRRFAYAQSQYARLNGPNYGKVEVYLISNAIAGAGWNTYGQVVKPVPPDQLKASGADITLVHESRCIRFDGNPADIVTRQRLAGWNWSVLQVVYDAMRKFEHCFDSAEYLLADASQGVFKLHGLMKAITAGQRQALAQRVMVMEQTRSVMRGIALDAGNADGKGAESFERIATPFGGVADVLDRMMLILAAAVDMPATELFGRAPAGLNATGESDIRKWYDTIASLQKSQLAPRQRRILRLAALAKNSPLKGRDTKWRINYNPLWNPSDQEVAQAGLQNAQRDQIYLDEGVVTAPEVGAGLGQIYKHMDVEAREEEIQSKDFDPMLHHAVQTKALENAKDAQPTDAGEPQSPTTPMSTIGKQKPGSAASGRSVGGTPLIGTDKPIAKPAKVADSRMDSKNIALAVKHQMEDDYPPELLEWVEAGDWEGPRRVPVSKVNYIGKEKWSASHDPAHVEVMRNRITQGIEKPVILAKEPNSAKLFIVDGHHRALAYEQLGKPLKAYIVKVPSDGGPWRSLHSKQSEGMYGSAQKGRPEA
jgi:phage-related protein (TIGR01555 family)